MSGFTERAYHVGNLIAYIEVAELSTRDAYCLDNKRDGASLGVGIGNSEWHTLAFLVHAYDDEVTSTACFRNQRCFYHQLIYFLGELLLCNDFVHCFLWFCVMIM